MNHQHAINLLIKRLTVLNEELEKSEKIMDEPEMLSDLEFARIDCLNFEIEINSILQSIATLKNN